MNDKNVDESWKQDRVSNRRRLSAIPMGASRLVAVQESEHAGTPTEQMAVRRQTRRSISNPQAYLPPPGDVEAGGTTKAGGGAAPSRPSTKGVFNNAPDIALASTKEEEEGEEEEEEEDWDTVKRKKAALMDQQDVIEMKEATVTPATKPMEPLEQEKAGTTKKTKEEEPAEEHSILDTFAKIPMPDFKLPTMSMPWDTVDVKDTSKHTAI